MRDFTKILCAALEEVYADYCTDYSGRGMFGGTCVAVVCDDLKEALELVIELAQEALNNFHLPAPEIDSFGTGVIMYWPSAKTKGE